MPAMPAPAVSAGAAPDAGGQPASSSNSLVFPADLYAERRRAIIRHWSRALLSACGLQVRVHVTARRRGDAGRLVAGGPRPDCMLVANHVSWLDIFAINALATSAFVAKAELRRWPVAGWLAALAGTVFIERARRHAVHQVIEQLRQRIREGFPVAMFPEATTRRVVPAAVLRQPARGRDCRKMRRSFRSRFATWTRAGAPAARRAYVGDTTFVESLWMVLGARGLVVDVQVLPPVPTTGRNRHDLARELRGLISCPPGTCRRRTWHLEQLPGFEPHRAEAAAPDAAGIERQQVRAGRPDRASTSGRRRRSWPPPGAPGMSNHGTLGRAAHRSGCSVLDRSSRPSLSR